jgi:hypothetical protein
MGWGQLLGAGAGFLIGGPAGMSLGASLGGAAEEATGGGASGAAREAAQLSNAAAERDLALRTRMYEEGVARQQPYSNIGMEFTNRLADMQRGGPGAGMNMLNMDPGYNFRLGEGMKALERQTAARGGLISGGALKAAQRYGQDFASNEFGNAYNRMAGLASLGPSSAGVMNSLGTTYASGAGSTMMNQGDTSANALLASQRARSSSYGQLGSALSKYINPTYNYNAFGGGSGTFGEGEY